jgi:hypothetical protein
MEPTDYRRFALRVFILKPRCVVAIASRLMQLADNAPPPPTHHEGTLTGS